MTDQLSEDSKLLATKVVDQLTEIITFFYARYSKMDYRDFEIIIKNFKRGWGLK